MNKIVFEHVSKSYDGKVNVIDDLNLVIPSGKRVILLGPSGCGKTTILRLIAGLEYVTSGDLYLGSFCVNDVEPGDRNIAMVFQNYALYPHMTVEQNILFGMRIAKVPKEKQQEQLDLTLNLLGLATYKKRFPKELSGGQRQRVALCRALVKHSPYFLLDEPLSNLDAQLRTSARADLVRIHGIYNPTFVYVTHDQVEAMTVGQLIVVMNKGAAIQQYDTPEIVYNRPKNVFVAKFIGSPSMNVAEVGISNGCLHIDGGTVHLPECWLKLIGDRTTVKLGIRPEHFQLSMDSGQQKINVSYMENHGNCKCITFNLGGVVMTATTDFQTNISSDMYVTFPWHQVHFFDAKTDENIGYPENEV